MDGYLLSCIDIFLNIYVHLYMCMYLCVCVTKTSFVAAANYCVGMYTVVCASHSPSYLLCCT